MIIKETGEIGEVGEVGETGEIGEMLKEMATQHKIAVSDQNAHTFELYADMLLEWNRKINLTAIEAVEDIVLKHFIDSILVLNSVKELKSGAVKLIDVGTGAGFPGVPFKIINRDIELVLLDSLAKRVDFLKELTASLKIIDGVSVIHMRAEDGGRKPELREKFDFAVARAVAGLPVLLEYCMPFVKPGGMFIAMKGPDPKEEIESAANAIFELGGEIHGIESYNIGKNQGRSIIKIKKIRQLTSKYPRKAGIPSRKPL